MYKKTFLTLMTTLVVCQSATAGFFKTAKLFAFKHPTSQLRSAIWNNSYPQFAKIMKPAYETKHVQNTLKFSEIKDDLLETNEKELKELKNQLPEQNYNAPLIKESLRQLAVFSIVPAVGFVHGAAETGSWMFGLAMIPLATIGTPFVNICTYWSLQELYKGIRYKKYVQNKIDQQEKIKQLIETTKDQ
jgi:hypothetical protein